MKGQTGPHPYENLRKPEYFPSEEFFVRGLFTAPARNYRNNVTCPLMGCQGFDDLAILAVECVKLLKTE